MNWEKHRVELERCFARMLIATTTQSSKMPQPEHGTNN
jgi:hypothetical protein